jgi:hypothetical protein
LESLEAKTQADEILRASGLDILGSLVDWTDFLAHGETKPK